MSWEGVANIVSGLASLIWRNTPAVILSLSGYTCLGFLLGLFCFLIFLAFRRRGYLDVGPRFDTYGRPILLVVWAIALPLVGCIAGIIVGAAGATRHVIRHEHLGQLAGEAAFKGLVSAVLASDQNSTLSHNERVAYARALASGDQKIEIVYLQNASSRRFAQLSTEQMDDYIPLENPALRGLVSWGVEHGLDVLAYASSGTSGDVIYQSCQELAREDARTDGDGLMTVEEISHVLCRTHLDRSLANWVFIGIASQALPFLLTLPIMVTVPLLLVALVNWGYRRRPTAPQENSPPTES
ncbi:MAG: hypothetical protein AB7S38_39915 [Vulcanimicrobiota bacterium]